MCFPQKLVELLAREVLQTNKRLLSELEAKERRPLTTAEKEAVMQQAFSFVLKNYAKQDDWKELKSAIGKKMNQWRQEKKLLEDALWQNRMEDARQLENSELVRSGDLDPDDLAELQ